MVAFPSCNCFSLCTDQEVLTFHSRLPVVHSEASPWYGYLRKLYSSRVTFPIDLRSFEAFFPALLPVAQRNCTAAYRWF